MKVVVIGAGLAGLTAACDLVDGGHDVTVLERRPWAGGKTYSFVERETGEAVDNGQHILMQCTTAHRALLRRLGTEHLVRWQDRLHVPVIDARGRRSHLSAAALPAPLHLLLSFMLYRHLSPADKARAVPAMLAMRRMSEAKRLALHQITFGDWLRSHGQRRAAIREFWDLIVVPALNAPSDEVSAAQAIFVFKQGVLASASAAAIGVPAVGLSELHVEPAVRYITERGGAVRTGAGVESITVDSAHVEEISLTSGERVSADAYVAALPPRELLAALPAEVRASAPFAELGALRASPIINVHCWFDGPLLDVPFAAFVGCELQWLFVPPPQPPQAAGTHVVLSLSAAERYMHLSKQELLDRLLPQLEAALPRTRRRKLLRAAVVKEPEATFVPAAGLIRPGAQTPVGNLVLAGAYADAGWPATMESAVRSGHAAARAVGAIPRVNRQEARIAGVA